MKIFKPYVVLTFCLSLMACQPAVLNRSLSLANKVIVPAGVAELQVEVLASYPHDPQAFTQGLVWDDGILYETTGLYGQSTLRETRPETGEVVRQTPLDAPFFGEGLAQIGENFVWLTYKEQTAFVFNSQFEPQQQFSYTGEGWGLCFDGEDLYMSNGQAQLVRRDPQTFAEELVLPVLQDGEPVVRLNELECVGRYVYANVWLTNTIVQIDKTTGQVVAEITAEGLLTPAEQTNLHDPHNDVLNGIAYDPDQEAFWITGKRWPRLFLVRFVPYKGVGNGE